ncbi:MAG: CatB-related O-acetyltransferase [Rickettsiales bacterium]
MSEISAKPAQAAKISPASLPPANKIVLLNKLRMNPSMTVGDHTYGNEGGLPDIQWLDGNSEKVTLTIGKYCAFANDVKILMGGNHRTDWITGYPFRGPTLERKTPISKGDVIIGNDVWLGTECMILSGLTIGNGAVIAARAVVTKDVPAYAIVAGNPAKVVKMRFSDAVIAKLEDIRWWDWPQDKIERNLHILCSGDTDRLDQLV